MKTEKNILIAFTLNLAFSVFEIWGGVYTGSVAIISDALHDLGDAVSIGLSFFFEKKSRRPPDGRYTYGYLRYSVVGALITTLFLLFGSVAVLYNAVNRMINPTEIHGEGMILLAIVGIGVNFVAAYFTHGGDSFNQKAVNLHMLEDGLGWVVVLVGGIGIKLTGWFLIDPVLSVVVAGFILLHAIRHVKETLGICLEKVPSDMRVEEVENRIRSIESVLDVHHIHLWSMDGQNHCATLHVVTHADSHEIKERIKHKLYEYGIRHVTLELEHEHENCHEKNCLIQSDEGAQHHHAHHII